MTSASARRSSFRFAQYLPSVYFRLSLPRFVSTQESVCACFGSGISTACVVDVGAQKTAVCCVEDGLSLTKTRYNR